MTLHCGSGELDENLGCRQYFDPPLSLRFVLCLEGSLELCAQLLDKKGDERVDCVTDGLLCETYDSTRT